MVGSLLFLRKITGDSGGGVSDPWVFHLVKLSFFFKHSSEEQTVTMAGKRVELEVTTLAE